MYRHNPVTLEYASSQELIDQKVNILKKVLTSKIGPTFNREAFHILLAHHAGLITEDNAHQIKVGKVTRTDLRNEDVRWHIIVVNREKFTTDGVCFEMTVDQYDWFNLMAVIANNRFRNPEQGIWQSAQDELNAYEQNIKAK